MAFGRKITLFSQQSDILFRYFGWESLQAKSKTADDIFSQPIQAQWFNDYNSLERGLQPNKIAILLTGQSDKREFIYPLSESESYQLSRYGEDM